MKGTTMTDTPSPLALQLKQQAVCHTDHPAEAASALIAAATDILVHRFGVEGTVQLMTGIIETAGSEWRRLHAH